MAPRTADIVTVDLAQFWTDHKNELLPLIRCTFVTYQGVIDDRFKSTNIFKLHHIFDDNKQRHRIVLEDPDHSIKEDNDDDDIIRTIPLAKFQNDQWVIMKSHKEPATLSCAYTCDGCRHLLWAYSKTNPINAKMCTECDFDLCEHCINKPHLHEMFHYDGTTLHIGVAYESKLISSHDITLV